MSKTVVAPICCALLLALAACAGDPYFYQAPPGVSEDRMHRDAQACKEESGIVRLDDEQKDLEHNCMAQRGYIVKRKG